jgi:hypothetical protein
MRKPFQVYRFICIICNRSFTANKSHAKTCSDTCRSIKCRIKKMGSKAVDEGLVPKKSLQNVSETTAVDVKFKPWLIKNTSINAPFNDEFEFEILTNSYGYSVRFMGFERSLFSVTGDRGIISDFVNYLLKRRQFYFDLTKEDQEKVECLKIILENRNFIVKNTWSSEKGCDRFISTVIMEGRTISGPKFQFHY